MMVLPDEARGCRVKARVRTQPAVQAADAAQGTLTQAWSPIGGITSYRASGRAIPELDENSWHGRVDPGDIVGVAGDDGVTALPGAEHDMDVNYVVMVNLRAHQPDTPRHAQRHDRDVDTGRPEQPGQTGLARTAPRLRDDFGRDADTSPAPPSLVQSSLHDYGLARVVEREKRAGVEREPVRRSRVHLAGLSLSPGRSVSPT